LGVPCAVARRTHELLSVMAMKNNHITKRRGVAQAIVVFLLVLILAGALYIPLNYSITTFNSLQTSGILSGYDASSLSFVNTYWAWLPAIILFATIPFVYLRAQKRGIGD
jgi:hypothetical protein